MKVVLSGGYEGGTEVDWPELEDGTVPDGDVQTFNGQLYRNDRALSNPNQAVFIGMAPTEF